MKARLIARFDVGKGHGAGHAMRCLSLLQAWTALGGQAVSVTDCAPGSVMDALLASGVEVAGVRGGRPDPVDVGTIRGFVAEGDVAAVLLDGYHFDVAAIKAVAALGVPVVLMDDCRDLPVYAVDIVVNQNPASEAWSYAEAGLELKGARYALLRREFLDSLTESADRKGRPLRLLISMGGTDQNNATGNALAALAFVSRDIEAKVVLGPTNPHGPAIRALAEAMPVVTVVDDFGAMPSLMAWADAALVAGGGTCWELCLYGVPFVVVANAQNQLANCEILDRAGIGCFAGRREALDAKRLGSILQSFLADDEALAERGRRGRELVDGRGARRVAGAILGLGLNLRATGEGDLDLLFRWANTPRVRASAFCPEPIAMGTHREWFVEKMASPDCDMFIGELADGTPFGQVRFDMEAGRAEVDVSVDENFQGCGLGGRLISLGVDAMRAKHGPCAISALVKESNPASIRSFLRAGFQRVGGPCLIKGYPCVRLEHAGRQERA